MKSSTLKRTLFFYWKLIFQPLFGSVGTSGAVNFPEGTHGISHKMGALQGWSSKCWQGPRVSLASFSQHGTHGTINLAIAPQATSHRAPGRWGTWSHVGPDGQLRRRSRPQQQWASEKVLLGGGNPCHPIGRRGHESIIFSKSCELPMHPNYRGRVEDMNCMSMWMWLFILYIGGPFI